MRREYPFRLYEKVAATVLAAAMLTFPFTFARAPAPDFSVRVCFAIGPIVVKCWDIGSDEPQPCPPPRPSCDPSTQSCPS